MTRLAPHDIASELGVVIAQRFLPREHYRAFDRAVRVEGVETAARRADDSDASSARRSASVKTLQDMCLSPMIGHIIKAGVTGCRATMTIIRISFRLKSIND